MSRIVPGGVTAPAGFRAAGVACGIKKQKTAEPPLDRWADAGEVRAAVDLLEPLLRERPDHGPAWILMGAARLETREPELALAAFEHALKCRPGDPAALVGHGTAAVALGMNDLAIA